jgi:hypothetical protein|tara:strand:- start:681 stop:917 length:237 start_codon:yes stop_codon:yes gene_type:complete
MKKKQETVKLSKKSKKTIDDFINALSEINRIQNKTVSKYYSFKNTLKDCLNIIYSEQHKHQFTGFQIPLILKHKMDAQ